MEGLQRLKHLQSVIATTVIQKNILEAAKAADARFSVGAPLSIFDGVPVAVKDRTAWPYNNKHIHILIVHQR